MQQIYTGDLRPFPGLPDGSPHKQRLAGAVLDDAKRIFPGASFEMEPGADIENFWEDACRASAAWHASGRDLEIATPTTLWTPDMHSRRLGPVSVIEEGRHATDEYVDHPLVRQHGGRAMLLGAINESAQTDVCTWLAARHRDHGIRHGVVKAAARKSGIWSIELDSDPEVIDARLLDVMEWDYIRLEGRPSSVFVQDQLQLEWEYRFFVVDGKLISGAGCVEEFTPLDRETLDPFDARMRRTRGHLGGLPSEVESRPDLLAAFTEFATDVAAQYGGTVVIDIAMSVDAAGATTPVVIELNPLPNSGLFASDPWAVAAALVTATDRGYRLSPLTSSKARNRCRVLQTPSEAAL